MRALTIAEIIAALAVISLILLQDRSTEGGGGIFGGTGITEFYSRRRGMEKVIFGLTIIAIVALGALLIYQLVLSNR